MDFRLERRLEIVFHPNGVHTTLRDTPSEMYEHLKITYNPKKSGTKNSHALVELRDDVIPRDFRQNDEVAMHLCDGVRFGSVINEDTSFFGREIRGVIHFTKHIDEGNVVIWLPSKMDQQQRRYILEKFEETRRTHRTYRLFLTHTEDRGSYNKKT